MTDPATRPGGAAAGTSERRPITVLFADIAGSTAIAEGMDPEDWTAVVSGAFQHMNRTIERYDGTIARLMGDGVLAFFGAPVAHEDDPQRAVRCALDMVKAIDAYAADMRAKGGVDLRVRVGVNTGPVVVGTVGTAAAHEYTAMGDTVNVAARMQAAAPAGGVLITAATYRFVEQIVDVVDKGPLELKGKTVAVRAYELTALRERVSVRGLEAMRAPMVGRDEPLARLDALFAVVRARQGRVASVLGEPGIGKTRLLAELRVRVERTDPAVRWIEGRCLTYGAALPYHLVLDIVRSIIGVSQSAAEPEVRGALERELRRLLADEWADAYAYLGHLLSVRLDGDAAARVSATEGETVKRYVAALLTLLRAMTQRGPVVLVIEDLHWADPASVDLLLQLLPIAANLPILAIVTSRIERKAEGWRLVAAARDLFGDALAELRIGPLTADESRALVESLLEIRSLPAGTRDLILAKAEGNPFFVEEVIRMLIDRGAIVSEGDRWVATDRVGDVDVPDTLHGLLLARIDRLPSESKRTLRVASVIGRQFGVHVLERLLDAERS